MAARDLSLETLVLEQDGRVLTARFSHPPHNFLTTGFIRDLDQLTQAVARDRTVGAVVLTGGVEGRFLTHADPLELGGMQDLPHPQLPMRLVELFVPVLNVLLRLPGLAAALERFGGAPGRGVVMGWRWKRTILRMNRSSAVYLAAINGPVLGGGQEIVRPATFATSPTALRCGWGRSRCWSGRFPAAAGASGSCACSAPRGRSSTSSNAPR